MFKKFNDNLVTYYPDNKTKEAFDIMFGRDANKRKEWLRIPIKNPTKEEAALVKTTGNSSCTSLIHYEGKEHALSNLIQKLWNAVDGMKERS
jgi:hypothetical protein